MYRKVAVYYTTAEIPDHLKLGTTTDPDAFLDTENPLFSSLWIDKDPIDDGPQQGYILSKMEKGKPILIVSNQNTVHVTVNPNGAIKHKVPVTKNNLNGYIQAPSIFNVIFVPLGPNGGRITKQVTIFWLPSIKCK